MIDLTHKINSKIREYPGDIKTTFSCVNEDDCTVTNLNIALHTGTHIDTPYHYYKDEKRVIDYDLSAFCGRASVLSCENIVKNQAINLDNIIVKNSLEKIIIINTGWHNNFASDEYFYENPYLSSEFSDYLIENNIKGIAIDTCSVDKFGENKIHKKLLKKDIWIVENLANCDKLVKNSYDAFFIPLKIDAEASLIRAYVKK